MRQARLSKQKTLADYDFTFPKRIPKTAIGRLFDCVVKVKKGLMGTWRPG